MMPLMSLLVALNWALQSISIDVLSGYNKPENCDF
ncbi:hypothetical protein SGGBAA2069_c00310 [Streptococcus gallolyticus subsp. gallolyticus ATCC BAA-2069]|nr:hypothetical protein SGGBAA2069_c00310 [Streptococcus gallolyticus subsp. gallolyticus ATCC BAA-2069]